MITKLQNTSADKIYIKGNISSDLKYITTVTDNSELFDAQLAAGEIREMLVSVSPEFLSQEEFERYLEKATAFEIFTLIVQSDWLYRDIMPIDKCPDEMRKMRQIKYWQQMHPIALQYLMNLQAGKYNDFCLSGRTFSTYTEAKSYYMALIAQNCQERVLCFYSISSLRANTITVVSNKFVPQILLSNVVEKTLLDTYECWPYHFYKVNCDSFDFKNKQSRRRYASRLLSERPNTPIVYEEGERIILNI